MYSIIILGIRGVPARHGGFETFAENLSLYLAARGWRVTVYCQEDGAGSPYESTWSGVRRIHIPAERSGVAGTIVFDWKAACHARQQDGLLLTLGYNTACFNLVQRFCGQTNIINMDGIEWRRDKWGVIAKAWFWINERAGCWIGNHLVADHPKIKDHLSTRVRSDKITMIPYGADDIQSADVGTLAEFGVKPGEYSVIIARPEPENSFLEMVKAFSRRKRNHKLIVLGSFSPGSNSYHHHVLEAASEEVVFPGAIYETKVVEALRFFSRFYLHGHRVGGTNPSLVEAMGAGCSVIAHDNEFNRWVVGDGAIYFSGEEQLAKLFDEALHDDVLNAELRRSSKQRFLECFRWETVLQQYENLLLEWYPKEERN